MTFRVAGILAAATLCISSTVAAQDRACTRIDRSNLVRCALSASLVLEAEGQELEAARGRERSAGAVLPSNPVLSLSGARRTAGESNASNWYVTIEQELEVAGQRGVRRDAAAAAASAQNQRVVAARQDVAESAWRLFFEALASSEELRLATRLAQLSARVSEVAQARADQSVGSLVDADLAAAATVAAVIAQIDAERRLQQGRAGLSSLLGAEPSSSTIIIDGDLRPLEGVSEALAQYTVGSLSQRPELLAAQAEARAHERRAETYRRERIPNPILSVFAQNDGFNERVLGIGVAFPIPIPGNVGHTNVGEIAEAEALAGKARTDGEQIRRDIQLEIASARLDFEAAAKAVESFPEQQLARTEQSLEALAAEAEAGRLAVREATVSQQALIELLRSHVSRRKELCTASIALARALGLPLDGSF